MEDIHGYDAEFLDDVPDHLKCTICLMVLKNPVQLADCGHRFCYDCYISIKNCAASRREELLCPNDRKTINDTNIFEDKAIERVILDLRVSCDNLDQGCHWRGELRQLQHHLEINCFVEGQGTVATISSNMQKLADKLQLLSEKVEMYRCQDSLKTHLLEEQYQEIATRCLLLGEQCSELSTSRDVAKTELTNIQQVMSNPNLQHDEKYNELKDQLVLLRTEMLDMKDFIEKEKSSWIFVFVCVVIFLLSIMICK